MRKEVLQLDPNFSAYHAQPENSPNGGLVILQEIFGVNSHIRDVCDHWARRGFDCVAPALFDPVERNVELGYAPDDMERGRALVQKVGWDRALDGVQLAINELHRRKHTHVSVMGYCYGGSLAFLAATRLMNLNRAVSYYGRQVDDFRDEKPRVPVIFHFGLRDEHIPLDLIDRVKTAQAPAPVYMYDAGHGFNCDQRGSFNPEASRLAEERSYDFLKPRSELELH